MTMRTLLLFVLTLPGQPLGHCELHSTGKASSLLMAFGTTTQST